MINLLILASSQQIFIEYLLMVATILGTENTATIRMEFSTEGRENNR
jgi:hypothetical protein